MSIRVRYIVALLLTATLVTLSFIVLYELISDQKKDAEIINIAGQQRMLSQRIALLTSTPNICEDSEEQRYLTQSLARFKQNHQQLVSLDNLPASISNTYFNVTEPSSVNLIALLNKLCRICEIRVISPLMT